KYAWRTFQNLSQRKGKMQFEVAELYPGFKPLGNVIVPVQVIVDGTPKEKIFLRTTVAILKDVVIANRSIRKGEEIGADDVALKQRDISRVYTKNYFTSSEEVVGKEVKTYIPRQYIVIDWMIKQRSLVRKKDKVKIKAVVGDVVVYAEGEALEGGGMDKKVRVKNTVSKKILTGTVIGTGEVEVETL
ncbi:flagellar basal body P-ring formation chaperone FlgA, partial [Candidatus Margulisiibacteriota bacterium]